MNVEVSPGKCRRTPGVVLAKRFVEVKRCCAIAAQNAVLQIVERVVMTTNVIADMVKEGVPFKVGLCNAHFDKRVDNGYVV